MERIYLPTLHWFAMDNSFTGSWENLRYRVVPSVVKGTGKEVDFANSTLLGQYWHGPLCYEKSTVEGDKIFPLSEEGLNGLKKWLAENI